MHQTKVFQSAFRVMVMASLSSKRMPDQPRNKLSGVSRFSEMSKPVGQNATLIIKHDKIMNKWVTAGYQAKDTC